MPPACLQTGGNLLVSRVNAVQPDGIDAPVRGRLAVKDSVSWPGRAIDLGQASAESAFDAPFALLGRPVQDVVGAHLCLARLPGFAGRGPLFFRIPEYSP